MKWMIVEINGITSIVGELNLEQKQEIVGGFIEFVNTQYGDMIVNEEGLLHGLPVNDVASLLAGKQIVGRVLMEVKEELEK
tara:strand:+ start:723 stop:965 length:243 start_codon:yes stop_codon:yes gene_type:complete